MSKSIDIDGRRFGRLLVGFHSHTTKYRDKRGILRNTHYYECLCDCGRIHITDKQSLLAGRTISCGCYRNENTGNRMRTHGGRGTRLYRIWCIMKTRCLNPNAENYACYGGRGIKVCARWINSFEAFRDDMGFPPSKTHSIDRIDNNGNYEPGNCRWATKKEQGRNTRTAIMVTLNGVTKSMRDWCDERGLKPGSVRYRLVVKGWSAEAALSFTLRNKKKKSAAL